MKGISDAMTGMLLVAMGISAVAGWVLIEGAIWLFSHITIGWV